jgi:ABC-type dipeptide/oligopeptide/nickel transport system permease component
MLRYVLVRIVGAVPVLLGITIAVFFMVRLVPGDPIDIMYANQAKPTPEQRAQIEREMGLDLPIHRQYVRFVGNALQGDLGTSYRTKLPVTGHITARIPNTAKLAAASLVVALAIGLTAGVLSATFRNSWLDRLSMLIAVIGVSIPAFWLGLMLILFFSVRLGWFPVAGSQGWKYLVLPAFTLGIVLSAVLARITRAGMIEALDQDYVRTARAKGLHEFVVVYRHALRNALIPIITIVGLLIGSLLSGAVIIEAVFGYPGLGLLAVQSLTTRDFPMIQGIVLVVAVVYVVVNLIVDILYGFIDPRIKYS